MESVAATVPAPDTKPVIALPVTVAAAMAVAAWVPVTSPTSEPEKLVAVVALVAEVAVVAEVALPDSAPENVGAVTVPVKVGEARGAFRAMFPSSLLAALSMVSVALTAPAPETKPVMALAVTVAALIAVAD